ncbi:MAG TPA: TIGR01777 family oxidoreductase [Gemmatimonadaceae bacterium]|nr:TIGR01777 family oxidoreductase [Gemmatimonadaceae bacterium]
MTETPDAGGDMADRETSVGPRTVAIGGASGMIGSAMGAALRARGVRVRPLVRDAKPKGEDEIWWNPDESQIDHEALRGVDAVLNFAGRSVDERWTETVKQEIRQSRVRSTRVLADTIARLSDGPRTLLVASGINYYGDRDDEILDETSPRGHGFLADVTVAWEDAADPAREAGARVINTRFGAVLAEEGGALARMLPVFRLGAGGTLGDGRQWFSWVAIEDLVRALMWLLFESAMDGAVNVTSPNPVTNAEFTDTLGRELHRPTIARVPEFALKLAFGGLAEEMLIASTRVVPRRLLEAGFEFRYAQLEEALRSILKS